MRTLTKAISFLLILSCTVNAEAIDYEKLKITEVNGANLPEYQYVNYRVCVTAKKAKHLIREIKMPKRMCIGKAQMEMAYGNWSWSVRESSMNSVTLDLKCAGKTGGGKLSVKVWAKFAPDEWSNDEVKKNCSPFPVIEVDNNRPGFCSCDCYQPSDGSVSHTTVVSDEFSCSTVCRATYPGLSSRCTPF